MAWLRRERHRQESEDSSIERVVRSDKQSESPDLGIGRYYIAPDSARPLPSTLWQGLDRRDLKEVVKESNNRLRSRLTGGEGEAPATTTEATFYVSPQQRQALTEYAGEALSSVLKDLDSVREG